MLDILQVWAALLWPSIQEDLAVVLIGGAIVIAIQLIDAGFGIWKNVGVREQAFDGKRFGLALARELGLVALLAASIVLIHMLGNLAGLSILPGFDVGDIPTAALLAAFAADIFQKAKNIFNNLLYIYNGEKEEIEEEE